MSKLLGVGVFGVEWFKDDCTVNLCMQSMDCRVKKTHKDVNDGKDLVHYFPFSK